MLAKQLKMSLLQVFSDMTIQRSGFGQNSCVADEQACVFGSCVFNKHSVLKIFMINGLFFKLCNLKTCNLVMKKQSTKCFCMILHKLFSYASAKLQTYSFDRTEI